VLDGAFVLLLEGALVLDGAYGTSRGLATRQRTRKCTSFIKNALCMWSLTGLSATSPNTRCWYMKAFKDRIFVGKDITTLKKSKGNVPSHIALVAERRWRARFREQ
jgi:hypothetical protein